MHRLNALANHFPTSNLVDGAATSKVGVQSDNDAVIVCALRTPLAKSKKGSFKDTYPEDLLAACYRGILEKTKIDPKLISDAQIGNVLQPGGGAVAARLSQFMAGLPDSVAVGGEARAIHGGSAGQRGGRILCLNGNTASYREVIGRI